MTHIGVHRLAAGDRQEGGAEHRETDAGSCMEEVADRAERTERGQYGGCTKDTGDSRPPMTVNHRSIAGPKMLPMKPVPLRWTRKNPIRIRTLTGTTIGASCGASIFSPSTALSTDIAGVITPSPYSSAAPINPTTSRDARQVPGGACRASEKRHDATLAAIVGAHDEDGVFDGDDHGSATRGSATRRP